ncbi:MAG: hypothetical protein H7A23_19735 [Leptospiraceae bacterium]|nr:hypothetical protein [Leptospiraceae bacterium]
MKTTETEKKEQIKQFLASPLSFGEGLGVRFFETLGYKSDKTPDYTKNDFKELFREKNIPEEKACFGEWKEANILFQYTKDEVLESHSLFENKKYNPNEYESYIFIGIQLKGDIYSKTKLSQITRAVNKLFMAPVMILFRYGSVLTLAIIDRRPNKLDVSKDVLEKVTLIKDIQVENPHRGHIEILYDLSLDCIKAKYSLSNFVDFHNAWQKVLDTKES